MRENKMKELRKIRSKYAFLETQEPSSSLDQDFQQALNLVPDRDLARALSIAFRASETPPFPAMLAVLYQSSQERRFRAELLNHIFTAVPELFVELSFLKQSTIGAISPKETDNISPEQLVAIASAAELIKPEIVDEISAYYAGRRSLLVNLSPRARVFILTTLAKFDTQGKFEGSRAVEQIFEMGPAPRYASVQIHEESFSGERGKEFTNNQPLRENHWYYFEVSVRVHPVGIPASGERRPIHEPKQSAPVEIIVTAEPDGFQIDQQVSKLVLPPKGSSTEQAIFRVSPIRHSSSAIDLLRIKFRLFYKFNLLEEFTVRAEAVSVLDDDSTSIWGRSPAIDMCHDRLRQNDLNDFDLITPACLHIYVEPYNDRYRLIFTLKHPERLSELAFAFEIRITPSQLESVIARVRKTLFRVCSSGQSAVGVNGSILEFDNHLRELSECGSDLWTLLFDPSRGQGAAITGSWLRDNPPPDGSKIQISIAGGATTFTLPWSLLYDKPCVADGPRSEHGFWGMRYVIEQRLSTLNLSTGQSQSEQGELEIGALYWKFAQTPEQHIFLLNLLKRTNKSKLALGKAINDAANAYCYLANCSSHIIYFFTHGHTALPDGERYGVTLEDFVKLYHRLPPEVREATKYIFENIEQRLYRSDESFIELTFGRLELRRLYKEITRLPMQPLVILNMCDSAQITPTLSESFIEFFLSRGSRAVIGTECSMRPVFADFMGRGLLDAMLQGQPIGKALLTLRNEAASRKNILGLAYTLFGSADASIKVTLSV